MGGGVDGSQPWTGSDQLAVTRNVNAPIASYRHEWRRTTGGLLGFENRTGAPGAVANIPLQTFPGYEFVENHPDNVLTGNVLGDNSLLLVRYYVAITPPTTGDGTFGNPWQIANVGNIAWMSAPNADVPTPTIAQRMNGYYVLMNNIDATSMGNNVMIGGTAASHQNFNGNFYGNGYTITVAINTTVVNSGLFRVIGSIGPGRVENLTVAGNVNSPPGIVGALAGTNNGIVINVHSIANVSGSSEVGGLVGFNALQGNITGSSATGAVTGSGAFVGPAIGDNQGTATWQVTFNPSGGTIKYRQSYPNHQPRTKRNTPNAKSTNSRANPYMESDRGI